METNLEIEFKTLLTETEYQSLIPLFKDFYIQKNYYFDTRDYSLFSKKQTCRIREKNSTFELTIKTQNKIGVNEHNQRIQNSEFQAYLKNGIKLNYDFIEPEQVFFIAYNTTKRYDLFLNKCLFSLDEVQIEDFIYYELEMETTDYSSGKRVFESFLKEHQIQYRENLSKSKNTLLYFKNKRKC